MPFPSGGLKFWVTALVNPLLLASVIGAPVSLLPAFLLRDFTETEFRGLWLLTEARDAQSF